MKKGRWILWLFVGLCLGVLACVAIYFVIQGGVDWETYLKETIIPEATVIATSVGTLCLLIQPIMNKIAESASLFKKAKEQIDDTVEGNKNQVTENAEVRAQVAALKEEVDEIKRVAEHNEQILRIGFGNLEELVVNGYAHEIAKVGAENGSEEKTELEV